MSKKIKKTADNVAIVAFSWFTQHYVEKLLGKSDWEFWGFNNLHVQFPEFVQYATRWFQVHGQKYLTYQRSGEQQF